MIVFNKNYSNMTKALEPFTWQ